MRKKLTHLGAALLFFALGCTATAVFDHGRGLELATIALAGGYTNLKGTSSQVSGNTCIFTFDFDRPVQEVTKNGTRVVAKFDNRCAYNCQRYNPASGRCAGPYMNSCY